MAPACGVGTPPDAPVPPVAPGEPSEPFPPTRTPKAPSAPSAPFAASAPLGPVLPSEPVASRRLVTPSAAFTTSLLVVTVIVLIRGLFAYRAALSTAHLSHAWMAENPGYRYRPGRE